ncbi:MAG TPA: hypothetical protein VD993_13670 [Chitinophagaceae bacterium]|nr:hypothetical protein [Chitinophagaceae bacterium]
MSNCRTIIFLLLSAVAVCSCRPRAQFFSYSRSVSLDFFDPVRPELNVTPQQNDSIDVYAALLQEKLVERDDVPEYKLINKKSNQQLSKLPDTRGFHFLYHFELFPKGGRGDTVIVYLATTYTADSICTNVGPVYAGKLRNSGTASFIQFDYAFKVRKVKRKHLDQEDKNISDSALQYLYYLKPDRPIHLTFVNEPPFLHGKGDSAYVQVKQIIQRDPNKIGGEKPVLYSVDKVFGDDKTLVFAYHASIKPCVCIQEGNQWFCMKRKRDGSLVLCDGPFGSKEECNAHSCNTK